MVPLRTINIKRSNAGKNKVLIASNRTNFFLWANVNASVAISTEAKIGLSHSTWHPAFRTWLINFACSEIGRAIYTASTSFNILSKSQKT